MPDTAFALITGASSGIGLELARCFVADGHDVVIAADDAHDLEEAASSLRAMGSAQVEAIPLDLARDGAARELYAAVRSRGIAPDYLVANAGVGVYGDFARETDLERELSMIRLNVISTVEITKLFARDMVNRGHGRILITASVAALAPSPKLAVYSATKAFDFAFAEAIANELKDTGVTVTALMPDATDTDFFERADAENSAIGQAEKTDPATIAKAGYTAMMKGSDHVVAPFTARMKLALVSVIPESLVTRMARAD